MKASENGDLEDVNRLLKEGADVNARTKDGWTALMGAAYIGRNDIVKVLLEHGCTGHLYRGLDGVEKCATVEGHIQTPCRFAHFQRCRGG